MAKSQVDGFFRTEALLDPEVRLPNIGEDVIQVLSRIMIFDKNLAIFRFPTSDYGGRQLVSRGPFTPSLPSETIAVISTTSPVTIVAANPKRQLLVLFPIQPLDVQIILSNEIGFVHVQNWQLPGGAYLPIEGFTGLVAAGLQKAGGAQGFSQIKIYEY